jgi:4-amino-4-deoxy-L-arabinose transferase-like glycosyltransferase
VVASSVEQVGGVLGLRVLSAVLMTIAAGFVYQAARRLFDGETALWTLLLFGFSGISISLGQQAVLDALGVPLLAMTLYWIVLALRSEGRQKLYLTLAGFTFSLSVLVKYIALLTLPALVVLIVVLHLYQGRSILSLLTRLPWLSFFVPMVIVLGIYGAFYFNDLLAVMSGQFASQTENRWVILLQMMQDIGLHIALALMGMVLLSWRAVERLGQQRRGVLVILLPLLALLVASVLILPLYHLISSNERSMWKHNVYTLVFITPLAGYTLARAIQFGRSLGSRKRVPLRLISAVATVVALIWFIASALEQNSAIQRSWPNNADEIAFLQTQNLTPNSRILSPSYAIYEYYFDTGVDDRTMWNNVWYTEYGASTGTQAIRQSIQECAYDLIVLDNYYAPEWAGTLEPLVQESGYAIIHSTMEHISSGDTIITNIYKLPEGSVCRGAI